MHARGLGFCLVLGCGANAVPANVATPTVTRSELATQMCALAKPCGALPGAAAAKCENAVAAALPPTVEEPAAKLALDAFRAAQPASCEDGVAPVVTTAVPLDLPKRTETSEILAVTVSARNTITIADAATANDATFLATAKAAHAKNPDVRVIIKADAAASHGTVIHVMELLKQAGLAKIAFGVEPLPP